MFSLHKKERICRFYNEDIWGYLRLKQRLNKTFVLLIKSYREKRAPFSLFSKTSIRKTRRRGLYGELLATRKKLSYFYGGAGSCRIKKSGNQTHDLHSFYSVLLTWEGRLSSTLYRANFTSSILEAFHLIFSGGVTIDREIICDPSYQLSVGQVVELVESRKLGYYCAFLKRLTLNSVPVVQPLHLEISIPLFSVVLVKKPLLSEFYYPFPLQV